MKTSIIDSPKFIRFLHKGILDHDKQEKFKLYALLFNKNILISKGINSSKKTHPLIKRKGFKKTVHAEINALIRVCNKDLIKGSTMIVYRQNNNGKMAMARPCEMCLNFLKESGVKNIIYSTDVGDWIKESIS